jgi:tetratricopeptide (TPR) repeat protein
MKIGLCYKNLGDYCRALEFLETALQIRNEDAELMAEIADCYAFIKRSKSIKNIFQGSFFY